MFRSKKILTTAALVTMCALPASAAAGPVDLRSPDSRDAAGNYAVEQVGSSVDLRSPDSREAAGSDAVEQVGSSVDLRSPDSRDAAGNYAASRRRPPSTCARRTRVTPRATRAPADGFRRRPALAGRP